jgi:hypothetical protein
MTKESLKKKYRDSDLQQAKELLEDFAKFYETETPEAINSVDCLRQTKDYLPDSMDDLTF